ncbi:MAG: hypothetical protein ACN4GW_18605 [Desulforhopalus sp.]
MIVRLLIAGFASLVAGFSYLTGLARLMTGLLLGFGAFSSFFFGILFVLPVDAERLLFPIYEKVPPWPYFVLGLLLTGLTLALFLLNVKPAKEEQVSALHFRYMVGGIGGYLSSLFLSSIYWFPSDARRLSAEESSLTLEVLFGTSLFLVGVSISCYLFYRASRGTTERNPDLMRRFVLGFFALFQLDKMPLLVAYLLIYSPETQVIFPNIAALALASYLPVSIFLLKTTLDCRER